MRFLLACALLVLLATNVELANRRRKTNKNNVAAALRAAGILADTNITAPQGYLQVIFNNNTQANLGNEIYPGDTINVTSIQFKANPGSYFTFIIIDIDFPSRADPFLAPSLRALWVNIQNSNLQSGDVVAQYVPATPPPGTGLHRVLLLYYLQTGCIDPAEIAYLNYVLSVFDLDGFVEEYDLCLEAANFYVTQFPDDLEEACAELEEDCED